MVLGVLVLLEWGLASVMVLVGGARVLVLVGLEWGACILVLVGCNYYVAQCFCCQHHHHHCCPQELRKDCYSA
jgi:hypothetical protein